MEGRTIEIRLAKALSNVGPSITAAAFCEFLAFMGKILIYQYSWRFFN
jgi:hypothetical protein